MPMSYKFQNFFHRYVPEWLQWTLVVAALLAISIGIWYGFSYMEAKSYNRLTGSDVSTVEAMFVKLRVEGSPTE